MTFEDTNDVDDRPSKLLKYCVSLCEDDENVITFQESKRKPEPQSENIDTWVPYEGQIFKSDENGYNFYSLFAKKNGFSIKRYRVCKCSKSKGEKNSSEVYRREFVHHPTSNVKP